MVEASTVTCFTCAKHRWRSVEVQSVLARGTKHQHLLHKPFDELICEHSLSPTLVIAALLDVSAAGAELPKSRPNYLPIRTLAQVPHLRCYFLPSLLVHLPLGIHLLFRRQAQAARVDHSRATRGRELGNYTSTTLRTSRDSRPCAKISTSTHDMG